MEDLRSWSLGPQDRSSSDPLSYTPPTKSQLMLGQSASASLIRIMPSCQITAPECPKTSRSDDNDFHSPPESSNSNALHIEFWDEPHQLRGGLRRCPFTWGSVSCDPIEMSRRGRRSRNVDHLNQFQIEHGSTDSNRNCIVPSRSGLRLRTEGLDFGHNYYIISYNERSLVLYNQTTGTIGVRPLLSSEVHRLKLDLCPMCGQTIPSGEFSYQAQTYFKILQDILRRHSKETTSRSGFTESPLGEFSTKPSSSRGFSNQFAWFPALKKVSIDESMSSPLKFENTFVNKTAGGSKKDTSGTPTDQASETQPHNLPSDLFITGYYSHFFKEVLSLGSGSYGQVYSCYHFLDDIFLGEYAIKKIPVGDDKTWLRKMLREVKIREKLNHRNIVQYKHSWLEMHRSASHLPLIPWLFVLMEFCNGGDLEGFLIRGDYVKGSYLNRAGSPQEWNYNVFPETCIWKLFSDIGHGLNHLHEAGIVHRDLKPSNILLKCTVNTLTEKPTTSALLSDFGTSERIFEQHHNRQGFTGTMEFTAPELLERDQTGALREDYDEKSDVWSLGITLFLMAYGDIPYKAATVKECAELILCHSDPTGLIPAFPERSTDLRLLIEACLQRDPQARPSVNDILNHQRIQNLTSHSLLEEAGYEITYMIGCQRLNLSRQNPAKFAGSYKGPERQADQSASLKNLQCIPAQVLPLNTARRKSQDYREKSCVD